MKIYKIAFNLAKFKNNTIHSFLIYLLSIKMKYKLCDSLCIIANRTSYNI